ncbi:MAG: glutamate-5-semialdehyde dehydrogenase [Pseudomonadota bacterium]
MTADLTRLHERARLARAAVPLLQAAGPQQRATGIRAMATSLRAAMPTILSANASDMQGAEATGLSAAMLDRLRLDEQRLLGIAASLDAIAALPDPIGRVIAETERPNGLRIQRVSVPLGVVGIIYESRPNVTADAAAICLKAANAVVLRGGSESAASAHAIVEALQQALADSGLPPSAVQMAPSQDRALVGAMLGGLQGQLDVLVPRGGRGLVERVQQEARVPVIGHLEGLCHVYVHSAADLDMAVDIAVNAKLRRTGICGAAETLLIDADWPTTHATRLVTALLDAGCELRGCVRAGALSSAIQPATEEDWRTEYLAPILAVRVVDNMAAALAHIGHYGSGHTESIITEDSAVAEQFLKAQDSAIVMHNASTQFADGGEFGMGAEIGISTSRIHARGPVGANELTSYKHVVRGSGQIRP